MPAKSQSRLPGFVARADFKHRAARPGLADDFLIQVVSNPQFVQTFQHSDKMPPAVFTKKIYDDWRFTGHSGTRKVGAGQNLQRLVVFQISMQFSQRSYFLSLK